MPTTRAVRSALTLALVFSLAACATEPTGPGGADDDLVFTNSSGAEIDVALTLPGGEQMNLTLPASNMAGETKVSVSFIEGDVYSFVIIHPAGLSASSSCTVSSAAVQSGVAAILVYIDVGIQSVVGECLSNWVESA